MHKPTETENKNKNEDDEELRGGILSTFVVPGLSGNLRIP